MINCHSFEFVMAVYYLILKISKALVKFGETKFLVICYEDCGLFLQ